MMDQEAQRRWCQSLSMSRVVDVVLIFALVSAAMMLAKHAFISEWNEVCCISIAFACGRYFLLIHTDSGEESDEQEWIHYQL